MTDADDGRRVYIDSSKGLYQYAYKSDGTVTTTITSRNLKRFDSTLLVEGSDKNDILSAIALEGTTSIMMSGGDGDDVYNVSKEVRQKLRKIIIDNNEYAKQKGKDVLNLVVDDTDKALFSQHGDDLVINDKLGLVRILKVFGDRKDEYNHLTLSVSDGSVTKESKIVDLVAQMGTFKVDPTSDQKPVYSFQELNSTFRS